ncbi:MAG: arginine--tRNA ligase [Actinomycetota bacterium]|nr:arginine--tRNA ligase [Actinomycetota bacterium]
MSTVEARLAPAFATVAGSAIDRPDPVVRPSEHADLQANGALALAKALGASPRDVAQQVLDRQPLAGIATAEIAGPGFLNITFEDEFLASELSSVADDDRLGVRRALSPERIVVDYSAPNATAELHVGHLRTTVIGDCLVRMLTFVGHRVMRENHIGDWGTPFGMLLEHLVELGEDAAAERLSLGDLDGFYREARVKFDTDEEFKERARRRVVLLQSHDPDTMRLWEMYVTLATRHFNHVYHRLGVLLSDDDLAGESSYQARMPEVIERLEAAGLLTESDGAQVVFPPGFTNREGNPLPLIVKARTGGFNYATSDLATIIDRVERRHADRMLYVVGAPQAQHFQMVFKVAEMAGWLPPAEATPGGHPPAVHVAFGNVLGPDHKMLKNRRGEPIKLIELVDEAVGRAAAAVAEKNPSLPADAAQHVAHAVGVGALKYSELSADRLRDYVFDWDRMLSFDGNTAPYLQYAHARILSIFRRAGIERGAARGQPVLLGQPQERDLGLRLLGYDAAVWDALDRYSPHRLCSYLYELASDFTSFYEHCPVLRSEEPLRASRLVLCDATASVLSHGLGLLGIDAPEVM